MNYENSTPDPFALDTIMPQRRPGFIARLISRSTGAIVKSTMLDVTKDRCQAQLTKTALEHTGTLSAMEARFSAETPQSTGRYRAIVDAYAVGAIQRIVRGDGYGR